MTLPFVQEGLLYHGEISDGCCCVPSHHVTSRNATGDVAICAGGAALPQRGVMLRAVRTVQRGVATCCHVTSRHLTSRNANGDVAMCAGGAALPRGDQRGVLLRAVQDGSAGYCYVLSRHVTSNGDVTICAGGAALPRGDQRGVLLRAVRTVQRQVLHQLPGIRAGHGPDAVLPDRELHPVLLLG